MTICAASGPVCFATSFASVMLGVALILVVIRLLRGPTTPDRVVALDTTALLAVGLITVHAIATDESSFLAGALVVGLISFLGTVAFARYLEKKVS